MKYATLTMLVPLSDDVTHIPKEWFATVPCHAYYAASIVDDPESIADSLKSGDAAIRRKIATDGLPKC